MTRTSDSKVKVSDATARLAAMAISRELARAQTMLEEAVKYGAHKGAINARELKRDEWLTAAKEIGANTAFTEARMKSQATALAAVGAA